MKQGKLILSLILVILVVVFAVYNTDLVTIDLFFTKLKVQMVLVILISLLIGVIVGLIASMSAISNQRREKKSIKKDYDQLHQVKMNEIESKDRELAELRAKLNDKRSQDNNTTVYSEDNNSLNL